MKDINSTARIYQGLSIAAPEVIATIAPNPMIDNGTIHYRVDEEAMITISVVDVKGSQVKVLVNKRLQPGTYTQTWNGGGLVKGVYFLKVTKNGEVKQNLRVVKG